MTASPISPSPCRDWAPARLRSAARPELRTAVLPKVRAGEWLAAFALSEKEAGSDVAAMRCAARADGDSYVLDGEKTWISNGGIADVYTVFARTGEAPGTRGISAFVVFADDPGFSIVERIEVIAPHPLATIRFDELPHSRLAPARRAGRGLQDRHAHARHLPRLGRRGRRSASRAGRSTRGWRMPRRAACSAPRSPTCN